LDRLNIGRRCL